MQLDYKMSSEATAAKKMSNMEAMNSLTGDELTATKVTEQEKLAKTARENQQIILYIFVFCYHRNCLRVGINGIFLHMGVPSDYFDVCCLVG